MHTNSEYEKIAIIVILSGCGLAIALAFAVLICCQLLIKPKYSRYGCPDSIVVFERQTTTSDENNIDYNSGCYEDSFYQKEQCDSDTNGDTISSPNTVIAQTHFTPSNGAQTTNTSPPPQRSSSPQVKFAPKPVKNRKTSLPCKLQSFQQKVETHSTVSNGKRRASAGIIRQKGFDDIEDIEEDVTFNDPELAERRRRNSCENKTISTDVLRKQYRELWQLRTTFEAEEMETSNESSDSMPSNQQKLIKNDSGYKSIERRDYSIDYKTEYIYRQFTATTPPRHSISHQQSIKEEQENETQATFV